MRRLIKGFTFSSMEKTFRRKLSKIDQYHVTSILKNGKRKQEFVKWIVSKMSNQLPNFDRVDAKSCKRGSEK